MLTLTRLVTLTFVLLSGLVFSGQLSAQSPETAAAAKSTAAAKASATLATDPADSKPDPRIGTRVIVTVAGALLKTPDATVWRAYLGETFTVSLTSGEWLWINDKRGWLWEKETVPFKTAISKMTAQAEADPSAENYHLRGIAFVAHREYNKAIVDFTKSLQLKKNNAGVLNNRGQAYYLKGDHASAIKDLNVAVTLDPKHFVAMNNRALCYIAKGELANAKKDLDAALLLNKEYPEALNNRGVVHSRSGDYQKAVTDLSAAIKIYENYTDAYGNRSFAYRKLNQFKEAVADVRQAMGIDATDYKPVNDLAWILATAGDASIRDPDSAIKEATKACEMTQYANWNTLDTLATAYAAKRDFKSALQWITTAVEKAPGKYKPMLEKHRQLIAAGKPVPQ